MPRPRKKPSEPGDTAKDILRKNAENLRLKLDRGGTLRQSEIQFLASIDGLLASADPISVNKVKIWADNKMELADALGISRPTLDKLFDRRGNPGRLSNGQYSVPAWRAFYGKPGRAKPTVLGRDNAHAKAHAHPVDGFTDIGKPEQVEPDYVSPREAELVARMRQKREDEAFEIETKRGLWLRKSDIGPAIKKANARVRTELVRRLLNVAPAQCKAVAGDEEKVREILRIHLEELLHFLYSGE